MLRTRTRVPWAPGASTPRLGFLLNSKDRAMAELIWLIIVLLVWIRVLIQCSRLDFGAPAGCIEKAQMLTRTKGGSRIQLQGHDQRTLRFRLGGAFALGARVRGPRSLSGPSRL
jgi:hypothetical protein